MLGLLAKHVSQYNLARVDLTLVLLFKCVQKLGDTLLHLLELSLSKVIRVLLILLKSKQLGLKPLLWVDKQRLHLVVRQI